MKAPGQRRYLWAFSAADEWTVDWHARNLRRLRALGFDIESFCVTPPELGRQWLRFPDLDLLWRCRHRPLLEMYERLAAALEGRDTLILYNGANLHPDFVSQLNVFKIYTVADPESAEVLGRPLSEPFDLVVVNQAAEIPRYKAWGRRAVEFLPLGSLTSEEDISITREEILDVSRRDLPVALFCENSPWRADRLRHLRLAFPDAQIAGRGWPTGFASWDDMWQAYRRTRIGWNLHNTVGFNFRTFDLPAYGVMEICDNKSDLAQLFELNREMVGFDTLEECVELTRYYLAHPDEQRRIALAGWQRWQRDYTPTKIWLRLVEIIERHAPSAAPDRGFTEGAHVQQYLVEHRERAWPAALVPRMIRTWKHWKGLCYRVLKPFLFWRRQRP